VRNIKKNAPRHNNSKNDTKINRKKQGNFGQDGHVRESQNWDTKINRYIRKNIIYFKI